MNRKPLILYCYDFGATKQTISLKQNLLGDIIAILNSVSDIKSKLRPISDIDENSESEFIASTTFYDKGISCCFIKMKKGAAANISTALLDMKDFNLEDTTKEDNTQISGHIKDYTYFFLTDRYLILKSGRIKFTEIEIYLNWLIKKSNKYSNEDLPLTLNAHIDNNYDVSNIKTIVLADGAKISKEKTVSAVITDIFVGLRERLQEAKTFEDIDPNDILSATISFRIKNHSKNVKESNKKLLQQLIKLFRDEEASFKDKKNSKILFNDVQKKKDIRVNFSGDYPDSSELASEMIAFIEEIL